MTTNNSKDARGAALAAVRTLRRAIGKSSLGKFIQTYLPAYANKPPSSMHLELVSLLEDAVCQRGARLAIAAPRGHAKTTLVSTAYVLWCICYGREQFIVLISATIDQAADLLSHVKKELETNPRLIQDFPEVCEVHGSKPGPARWRKHEIITRNDIKVTAIGRGGSLRGRKHRQHRPGLIILDDLEDQDSVRAEDQRHRTDEWFTKAVGNLGTTTTNLIVVGTVLHYDSLLCRLSDPVKSPAWIGHRYRAVISWSNRPELWERWQAIYRKLSEYQGATGPDAARAYFEEHRDPMLTGTKVLWPETEDYYQLMVIRERDGRTAFDSEKQNEPMNPDDCLFPPGDMRFWEDEFDNESELLTALARDSTMLGACDPSMGKVGKARAGGDCSAIITMLRHDVTGVMYVLDADIRLRKPDVIIRDVIEFHRRRDYMALAFENNGFQEFVAWRLAEESRKVRLPVPIEPITHTSDKKGRIQRLQPLVANGTIRFSRRHTMLLEQLSQFPLGAHDDGPDALEMAVLLAQQVPTAYEMWLDEQTTIQLARAFRDAGV